MGPWRHGVIAPLQAIATGVGVRMRRYMSCVLFGLALAGGLGAGCLLDWEVGDYWTYQVQARVNEGKTWPAPSAGGDIVTYYVVARRDLLWKMLWALAEVRELPFGSTILAPLLIFTSRPSPQPRGWPLPAQAAPRPEGITVVWRATSLPGEGVREIHEMQEDGTLHRYLVEGGGTEEITVPADTFSCTRIHYLELILQEGGEMWRHEGTAWWSEEVSWWVWIEGESRGSRLRTPGGYRLELSAWGHLGEEELKERFSTALSATAHWMPHLAREVEGQLAELGLELEIHTP